MPFLSGSSSRLSEWEKKNINIQILVQPPNRVSSPGFWKIPVFFFFPKKAARDIFFMFPLLAFFAASRVGSGGTFAMLRHVVVMRSRKNTSTTFWGFGMGVGNQKKEAHEVKNMVIFILNMMLMTSLIDCLCMFEHTYWTEAASSMCHVMSTWIYQLAPEINESISISLSSWHSWHDRRPLTRKAPTDLWVTLGIGALPQVDVQCQYPMPPFESKRFQWLPSK